MNPDTLFWQTMMELATNNKIIFDRPKGTAHPRYLENTTAGDGDGIDVWVGSLNDKTLTGILCTFDRLKRDAEIKLLIGCTPEEVQTIQHFNDRMRTLFIPNPMVEDDLSD